MIRRICATTILVLLLAMTPVGSGYAIAQPPVPNWDAVSFEAVLYETTENLSMKALERGRRKALSSSLVGFARRGSALCPDALVMAAKPEAPFCTLNSTGSDNISLTTGLGLFTGTLSVVVQEVNQLTGQPTPDSPEVVIATGNFTGRMDFRPAIVGVDDGHDGVVQLPLGSVVGHLTLDGFSKRVPFTGVFRLPFLFPAVAGDAPLYLLDPTTFTTVPVAPNEMAIGFPTVRFEITF